MSHPDKKKKKSIIIKKKERKEKREIKRSALVSSSRSSPGVCQRFLSPMQATRAQKVRPTPRGYLTNLFDVADPGAELPRCSDHSDHGETQALLLLRLLAGAGFSRCQAATQSARVGQRVTPGRRSRRLRRAHGGCYGDGEREGSLPPPPYPTNLKRSHCSKLPAG